MWSSWARPVLPTASLTSPARWHMVHSIHVSRHTVYWVQAQVGFGRVYFPGPNRVGARAHFMRWAQPILRLSRRACARANDGLAGVNAGQPLMKNLSHFVKSVLYLHNIYTILGQRRRGWDDVVWMLYKCFVFTGQAYYTLAQYTKDISIPPILDGISGEIENRLYRGDQRQRWLFMINW